MCFFFLTETFNEIKTFVQLRKTEGILFGNKRKMNPNCRNFQTAKKHVGRKAGLSFNPKGTYFFFSLILLTIVLQSFIFNVEAAETLVRAKKPRKLLRNPPSLIKLRYKRDTFSNEPQDEPSDYYDDNYDVLPDMSASSEPPTVEDLISEQAKRVAESFKKMWQSLTDSVRHCVNAVRVMFGEPLGDEDLTPEQEQEILAGLEAKYRLQQEQDNEILKHVRQNQV